MWTRVKQSYHVVTLSSVTIVVTIYLFSTYSASISLGNLLELIALHRVQWTHIFKCGRYVSSYADIGDRNFFKIRIESAAFNKTRYRFVQRKNRPARCYQQLISPSKSNARKVLARSPHSSQRKRRIKENIITRKQFWNACSLQVNAIYGDITMKPFLTY